MESACPIAGQELISFQIMAVSFYVRINFHNLCSVGEKGEVGEGDELLLFF